MNLAYPFNFDMGGHTAATDAPSHVRDMIEQILFTSPGERRPGLLCAAGKRRGDVC